MPWGLFAHFVTIRQKSFVASASIRDRLRHPRAMENLPSAVTSSAATCRASAAMKRPASIFEGGWKWAERPPLYFASFGPGIQRQSLTIAALPYFFFPTASFALAARSCCFFWLALSVFAFFCDACFCTAFGDRSPMVVLLSSGNGVVRETR